MELLTLMSGVQAEYDALTVKDVNTLYFCLDTHRIYKGPYLFASGLIENLNQVNPFEINGGGAPEVDGGGD